AKFLAAAVALERAVRCRIAVQLADAVMPTMRTFSSIWPDETFDVLMRPLLVGNMRERSQFLLRHPHLLPAHGGCSPARPPCIARTEQIKSRSDYRERRCSPCDVAVIMQSCKE